jgi:hypothetical protein
MPNVEYEGLDRLLGALGESIGRRVHLDEAALSQASSIPETLPDSWRDTATGVQVDTLSRGVPLKTVARGVLGHFLPAAAVVIAPLALVTFLANPLEYLLNLKVLGLLALTTLGFAVGLGALSPWLYPHSNPDGKRSEIAGFLSPLPWLVLGIALDQWPLPEVLASNLIVESVVGSVVLLTPGMALAVLAYAPWLRRTSRIAPVSPPGRWRKLRAIVVTGGLGAGLFGITHVLLALRGSLSRGIVWEGVLWMLAFGASFGFLVGVAFALALAVVYRRYSVEELRAWKVGLWAAAAAALPPLVIVFQRAPGQTELPHPLIELLWVLVLWNLPGFLMGYAAVKSAQGRLPTE